VTDKQILADPHGLLDDLEPRLEKAVDRRAKARAELAEAEKEYAEVREALERVNAVTAIYNPDHTLTGKVMDRCTGIRVRLKV